MKTLERVILVVGAAMMVGLLIKLDPAAVWANIMQVGWGLAILVPIHIVDHIINAQAWKLSFNPSEGARVPFWRLVWVRVAGDGVNYLTPSATIAGEVVRPAMLGTEVPSEARVASVVVAKFTQSLGQALFILTGIVFIAAARIPVADEFKGWFYAAVACLTAVFTALVLYAVLARKSKEEAAEPSHDLLPADGARAEERKGWSLKSFKRQMGTYFRRHPGRFAGSILLFALGYVWGTVEAFLICHFLGLPVTVTMAYAIEVLSSAVDGAFFMVPAKIGTQEAGKTAIFVGLGYPAATGFAFGLARHLRELIWAAFGFVLFSLHRRALDRGTAKVSRPEPETVRA
ncbi:MAG: flippase-like domain-containing protein [Elusimicrobia bacterium]|nr:flippase-like domain-containing protein [Elusimicrobiota bacterium]